MTLRRFTDRGDGNMCETAYGEWVRYDDVEELQKNAERYRWLRDEDRDTPEGAHEIYVTRHRLPHTEGSDVDLFGNELDSAIDAAIFAPGDVCRLSFECRISTNAESDKR